jgi:multiple sugar transport system substrate-binding protein
MSLENFQDTFVDVVYSDFVTKEEKEEEEEEGKEEIYAVPLYVDTLALYYNKDLFNTAGIPSPPTTWEELLDDVYKLTKRDEWGNIERSGIAMGAAENINRSTDILSLLMLQVGTQMTDENHLEATFNQIIRSGEERFNPGKDALRFYTDFSNSTKRIYCWNRQMPYSIDAFSQKKAAMMINYSHRIDTIRNISSYLNFEVVSVPQVKDRELDISYANYWGQTVSKKSEYPGEAWKFILFLTQEENAKKYLEKAKRPTSRRDLIEWQKDNPDLDVFVSQVLIAKSWYQADSQAIEIIFADMIESVVSKKADINQAINTAANQVNVLMKR